MERKTREKRKRKKKSERNKQRRNPKVKIKMIEGNTLQNCCDSLREETIKEMKEDKIIIIIIIMI